MKHLLAIFFLFAAFGFVRAQKANIVQFSGVIYDTDSSRIVPYVSVTNKSDKNRVTSANHQGYFSFVAHEGDTIVFSAIGYRREGLVIPTNLSDKRYTVLVKMKSEVINLPVVRILPWASIDDLNRDFMAMKFADDDLEIAKKNMARTSLLALSRTLKPNSTEMQNLSFANNHIALNNKHINQKGANPLLNPLAWGAFIQQILQGDKSRGSNN
ncbi:MAG: carboxypeptidase-like regulatory domain-containing protein [Pyrinomonadaceae bacterium]|nr:carboxypeptidase-like regulatory domain-containing protein [Sphingobacteriaceae bacterium]